MGDYKVGISSVKRSLDEWLRVDMNFPIELQQWTIDNKLSNLFVMTAHYKTEDLDEMGRELILSTKDEDLLSLTKKGLLNSKLQLKDTDWQAMTGPYITMAFDQFNVAATRKQLKPLLESIYNSKKEEVTVGM